MLGGAGVVQDAGQVGLLSQSIPEAPVIDAGRLTGDGDHAHVVLTAQLFQPGGNLAKVAGVVWHVEQGDQFLRACVDGQQAQGEVRHVRTHKQGQLIQVGVDQLVGLDPWQARQE